MRRYLKATTSEPKYRRICEICRKEFKSIVPHKKYCSVECSNKSYYGKNKQSVIQKACGICNKMFETTDSKRKYCSEECQREAWSRNMREVMKRYYRSHYDLAKTKIIKKYRGVCQICGSIDHQRFAVHHIIPRRLGGEDTEDNLTYLCNSCHHKLHQAIIKAIINSVPKEKQIEIIKRVTSEKVRR